MNASVPKPPVRFEVRVETRVLLVLFMIVWSGIAWAMTGFIGYGLLTEPLRFPELWFFWLIVLVAAVMSTSWIVW